MARHTTFKFTLLAASLTLVSGSALASTAILTGMTISANMTAHPNNESSVNVASIKAMLSGGGSFAAFCAQPLVNFQQQVVGQDSQGENIYGNPNYQDPVAVAVGGLANYSRVVTLFDRYYAQASVEPTYPLTGTPVVNASRFAFQLALWELVADDANISTGNYRFLPSSDSSYDPMRDYAASTPDGYVDYNMPIDMLIPNTDLVIQMLSDSNNLTPLPKYELMAVNHDTSQQMLIAVTTVPEPAGYLMLLAGATVLAGSRRRQRQA